MQSEAAKIGGPLFVTLYLIRVTSFFRFFRLISIPLEYDFYNGKYSCGCGSKKQLNNCYLIFNNRQLHFTNNLNFWYNGRHLIQQVTKPITKFDDIYLRVYNKWDWL